MVRTLGTAIALVLLATGCLTPKAVEPTRYYTVTPSEAVAGEPAKDASLGIRPLIAARPYKLEVAYRAETNRLAYFPRAEWAELPGTVVSRAVSDALSKSRLFADAGDATAMSRADYIFTGELRRFEADMAADTPAFVVTVFASIRSTSDEGPPLWRNEVTTRVPLEEAPVDRVAGEALSNVAQAASEAVTQLSAALCGQIRVAIAAAPAP